MARPLISTIVPIYNVEEYLCDTIESVISQSIGFMNQIELILIDDGSTDESGVIAKKYAERYSNITYTKIANGGVSRARNVGLKQARGKYVHFFDSDDIISKNFYKETTKFLEKNQKEIDFVAVKVKFFDAIIDSHPLNTKFHKTRIIDLLIEPDSPILHAVTCVYKRSAIDNISFDETLSISEDMKFLGEVLQNKKKYGVVKGSTYYYRKRTDASSAIGGKEYNEKYYTSTPEKVYKFLLKKWNNTPEYKKAIEYTVLYDASYRLLQKNQPILNSKQEQEYIETIISIITNCQDEVIISHRFLTVHQKIYILRKKHGISFNKKLKIENGVLYFDSHTLYSYEKTSLHIDFLTKGSQYVVEGYTDAPINLSIDGVSLTAVVSDKKVPLQFIERYQRQESFLGDVYNDGGAFQGAFLFPVKSEISFRVALPGGNHAAIIETGIFTRLGSLWSAYRRDEGRLIKRTYSSIQSYPYSIVRHVYFELRMLLGIILNWRITTAKEQFNKLVTRNLAQLSLQAKVFEVAKPLLFVVEAISMIPRALILRAGFYLGNQIKRRPIWIISDRGMAAGDNGEALFRYIQSLPDCPVDVFFALSKVSKDYERLASIGAVLDYGSLRYKQKFLLADKIISSHADVEVTNPFLRQVDHFVDLYDFDFVFLQHGVIRNDLSDWLNRFDKNIAVFITSAQKEYDSIFKYPYYYNENQVLLSGMPRYDYLIDENRGKVIIAPTYRNGLLRLKTDRYGARPYDNQFKNSEYFKFYNGFINDETVIRTMQKAKLKGEVYIHPNFASQLKDFESNDTFTVMPFPYDYKKAINEGALLISDYSSVALDFAYLKKPVIYSQFDAKAFFEAQPYNKGDFFNDEADGFGPVTYSYDELVKELVASIEKGCKVDSLYEKRTKYFFAHHDKKSSERIYKALAPRVYNENNLRKA